tara:strand:- start:3476 stop:4294 length:819 start_codon:yes stop_codon:yes gene_type:complete
MAMKVSYLGPKGSFSEIALFNYFDTSNTESVSESSIADVFRSVETKESDYGIIPIENSIEGSINNTHDLLIKSDVTISGEMELLINQCLLSKTNTIQDIEILYAHPQSLAQCKNYISLNLPDIKVLPVISNSEGAKMIVNSSQGCIGSEKLSTDYDLTIIDSGIQDFTDNTTRFIIIGQEIANKSKNDKTSIIVSPPDSQDSGSLFNVLKSFADFDVNLSRIESRPSKKGKWSYVFFIDLIGHSEDPNIVKSLNDLEEHEIKVKILGSYPIA